MDWYGRLLSGRASPEESDRVLHISPVQVRTRSDLTSESGEPVGAAVSYDVSRNGMRIFMALPIYDSEVAVRFLTPNGADVIQDAKLVGDVHRIEWIWEYELEFESPLSESAM